MRIIDISQEILSCNIYPGDPSPKSEKLKSMEQGEMYNLSVFSMCAHNGTHIDAPSHFIMDGKNIDELSLDSTVGYCYVARHVGDMTASDASAILRKARNAGAVLLEGIVLRDVLEGRYFLSAAPLNLKGFEGSPCRACLIEISGEERNGAE